MNIAFKVEIHSCMAKEKPTDLDSPENGREVRVSMLVQSAVLEKIKEIANREEMLPKEKIHQAILREIEMYESKNGPVKPSDE